MYDDKTRHIGVHIISDPSRMPVTYLPEGPTIEMKVCTDDLTFFDVRIRVCLFTKDDGTMIAGKGDRITITGEFGHDGVQAYFRAIRVVKYIGHLYPKPTPPDSLTQLRHKINTPEKEQ